MYVQGKTNICFCNFLVPTLVSSAHTHIIRKTNMCNNSQHTYGNGLTELFSFSKLQATAVIPIHILMPILLLLQRLTNVFSQVNT